MHRSRSVIAFLLVALAAGAWLEVRPAPRAPDTPGLPPVDDGAPLPLSQPDLTAWMMLRADQPTPDLRMLLAQLPGVAVWLHLAMPATARTPDLNLALAPFAYSQHEIGRISEHLGLSRDATLLLLSPPALETLTEACPELPVELLPLCDTRQVMADLDDLLASWLGVRDERTNLLAIDLCVGLGDRGAALAGRVLAGGVPGEDVVQQQASALIVRSWTLPRDEAIAELTGRLSEDGPLSLVAALELGRLGAAQSAGPLADLAARLEGSAEGVVADYALALATGTVRDFTAELRPPGL